MFVCVCGCCGRYWPRTISNEAPVSTGEKNVPHNIESMHMMLNVINGLYPYCIPIHFLLYTLIISVTLTLCPFATQWLLFLATNKCGWRTEEAGCSMLFIFSDKDDNDNWQHTQLPIYSILMVLQRHNIVAISQGINGRRESIN